jgi:hypothetical protein
LKEIDIHWVNENATLNANLLSFRSQFRDNRSKFAQCTQAFAEAATPCFTEAERNAVLKYRTLTFDLITDDQLLELFEKAAEEKTGCEKDFSLLAFIFTANDLFDEFFATVTERKFENLSVKNVFDAILKIITNNKECKYAEKVNSLVNSSELTQCPNLKALFEYLGKVTKPYCENNIV